MRAHIVHVSQWVSCTAGSSVRSLRMCRVYPFTLSRVSWALAPPYQWRYLMARRSHNHTLTRWFTMHATSGSNASSTIYSQDIFIPIIGIVHVATLGWVVAHVSMFYIVRMVVAFMSIIGTCKTVQTKCNNRTTGSAHVIISTMHVDEWPEYDEASSWYYTPHLQCITSNSIHTLPRLTALA